ncbi:uncharacterized protein N7496_004138 [Penicillium cataractarum]|uniref:BRCT domain-containing protein n=1 Tax=Penicillium cataractarum TaxID=2100454 RepID=A0A9W9SNK5_9EURO|nr:uncharacterized protein N7496_004138 [Penicillium cataractarum]KAJ5381710.1 hypothetical protein N7496_004138 [Penicillium cataractarum]
MARTDVSPDDTDIPDSESVEPYDTEVSDSDADSDLESVESPFKRLVIAASGRIPKYTHDEIQRIVQECGAKFKKLDMSAYTHLITTAGWYHSPAVPAKITEAQRVKTCDIVSIHWLLASSEAKRPLATNDFLIRMLGSKRPVPTTSNSVSNPSLKRKLRSSSIESEGRRTKGGADMVMANLDKPLALGDKEIPANGRKEPAVWVDDENVIWDATLVELSALDGITDPAKPSAKIIRIQLIIDSHEETYHTIIWEISSVETPTDTRKGDGRLLCAIAEFEAAFKRFTGLTWGERQQQPKKGKAIFIPLGSSASQGKLDWGARSALTKFANLGNLPAGKTLPSKPSEVA